MYIPIVIHCLFCSVEVSDCRSRDMKISYILDY